MKTISLIPMALIALVLATCTKDQENTDTPRTPRSELCSSYGEGIKVEVMQFNENSSWGISDYLSMAYPQSCRPYFPVAGGAPLSCPEQVTAHLVVVYAAEPNNGATYGALVYLHDYRTEAPAISGATVDLTIIFTDGTSALIEGAISPVIQGRPGRAYTIVLEAGNTDDLDEDMQILIPYDLPFHKGVSGFEVETGERLIQIPAPDPNLFCEFIGVLDEERAFLLD